MRRIVLITIVAVVLVGGLWFSNKNAQPTGPVSTAAVSSVTQNVPTTSAVSDPVVAGSPAAAPATTSQRGVLTETALSPKEPAPRETQPNSTGTASTKPTPIDVSPGFESLLAPATDPPDTSPSSAIVRRHRQLLTEVRDDEWAGRVEPDIRLYVEKSLTAEGLDPQRIQLSVIECRTTGCEIQAATVAQIEDGMKPNEPQMLFGRMVRGPLAGDFDPRDMMVMVTTLPDGRHGYVAFLPRKH
ncbi:MAG TPA: hypothetical protein VFS52_12650 [Steroidobacteraceae bacterium]|jgi:hypothetical protein|nr:hypothetical protein [Steroidobacteraceae bacterium]